MQYDTRRLSTAGLAVATATLIACRPSTSRSSTGDSATPGARVDSTPAPAAPATTRADSIVLRTDKAQYHAGEKMTLTLENKSAASYSFNPCTRSLEREDGATWTALPDEGRMCTMEAWLLDAHGIRSGPTELPSPLAPGRYRVVIRLTREQTSGMSSAAVSAVSDPITVS
jgi:hypothetical protein